MNLPPPQPKALSIISYDQYKDNGMLGFLEDDVWPLSDYLSWTVMVALVPSSMKIPGVPTFIPGESGSQKYPLSTEQARVFGHSLLKGIWDRYQVGQCLGEFDQSNIFVTPSGRAKFRHVELLLDNNVALLDRSLLNAHAVLLIVFTKDGVAIPKDIKYLLDRIQFDTLRLCDIFHISPALAPMSNGFAILTKMYEEATHTLSDTARKTVYRNLPHLADWDKEALLNDLLKSAYNHVPGRYDDPLPLFGQQAVPQQELAEKRGKNFADYMRNTTAHRMDLVRQPIGQAYQQQGKNVSMHSQPSQAQNVRMHGQVNQQQGQNVSIRGQPCQAQNVSMQSQPQAQKGRMHTLFNHPQGLPSQGLKTRNPSQLRQQPGHSSQFQKLRHVARSKGMSNVKPQYTADEHALAQYVHYPLFQVGFQEELFNIDPTHITKLNLQNLFTIGVS